MKILSRHKEKLQNLLVKEMPNISGFIWVNPFTKRQIFENVNETSFTSFYPNIIISLWDEGLINIDLDIKIIEKIRYFLQNRESIKNTPEYLPYRTYVNGVYGYISSREESKIVPLLIHNYLQMIFTEILDMNDNLLYIDTDIIYHLGELKFGDLDLKSISVSEITDVLCVHEEKRYLFHDGQKIGSKGFGKKREEVENEFKRVIRERKLNQLGL